MKNLFLDMMNPTINLLNTTNRMRKEFFEKKSCVQMSFIYCNRESFNVTFQTSGIISRKKAYGNVENLINLLTCTFGCRF